MKLTTRQIPAFLKAPAKDACGALVYGPDEGMVRERFRAIAETLVPDLADPFAVAELSPDQLKDDPARLADELCAVPLGGGMRLVMLPQASDAQTAAVEAALTESLTGTFLLVSAGDVPPRSKLRKFFEASKHAVTLPCYRDEGAALSQVISEALRGAGLAYESDVAPYLASQLGSDRAVTRSELEKLCLYAYGRERITLADARAVVGGAGLQALDTLAQAVAGGDTPRLESAMTRLLRDGTHPVAMVRGVSGYFWRLYNARTAMDAGAPADEAMKRLKPPVFFKQAPVMRQHLQRWRSDRLAWAMAQLLRCERRCKETGSPAENLTSILFHRLARG